MKRRSFLTMIASLFGWSFARGELIDHGPKVDNGPTSPTAPPPKKPAGIPYDADHRCDGCGHQSPAGEGTWIVRGSAPGGAHTHTCPKCGHTWQHGGAQSTQPHAHAEPVQQYTLPGTSSGCANGQCPTSVRRGVFRR